MTPHLKQAILELIRAYDASRINHYGFVLDIHRDVLDDLELAWIHEGKQRKQPRCLERCDDCLGQRVKGSAYHCES